MRTDQKHRWAFAQYDFSNSGYVVIFQSFLFPLVLARVSAPDAGSTWAVLVSASTVLAVILGPYFGRLADRRKKWTVFLILILATGVLAIAATASMQYVALIVGFLAFNTLFELSQTVYDSYLPDLSRNRAEATRLSAFAWGIGYLGGVFVIAVYLLLDGLGIPPSSSLPLFGVLFLLLSVPVPVLLRNVSNKLPSEAVHQSQRMSRPPVAWRLLAIYWVIVDGVSSVLYFAPLYFRETLGLSERVVGSILLGGQVLAFPLTIVVARVAIRIGIARTIQGSLLVWVVGVLLLSSARSVPHVIGVMALLAFVIGSTQALLRAHYSQYLAAGRTGEGFGWYAVAQKSASIAAPAMMALVLAQTGSYRLAFVALGVFLVVGFVASLSLNEPIGNETST